MKCLLDDRQEFKGISSRNNKLKWLLLFTSYTLKVKYQVSHNLAFSLKRIQWYPRENVNVTSPCPCFIILYFLIVIDFSKQEAMLDEILNLIL